MRVACAAFQEQTSDRPGYMYISDLFRLQRPAGGWWLCEKLETFKLKEKFHLNPLKQVTGRFVVMVASGLELVAFYRGTTADSLLSNIYENRWLLKANKKSSDNVITS